MFFYELAKYPPKKAKSVVKALATSIGTSTPEELSNQIPIIESAPAAVPPPTLE